MVDGGLPQFFVRLFVNGKEEELRCFADGFGHAEKKAKEAYPEGRVCSIHCLPDSKDQDE